MPTNPYFTFFPKDPSTESDLIDELIQESIQINGSDCTYIVRESRDVQDPLYGEDPVPVFRKAYIIEMYLQNVMGPEGDSEFFSKFGVEIRDSARFLVARRPFLKHVGLPASIERPREGDLIWVPWLNNLYEIKFVEEEKDFHSLGRRPPFFYFYELNLELFRFNNELIQTGIREIDQVGLDYAYTITLSMTQANTDSGGTYTTGELVFQGPNVAFANTVATVKSWNTSNNTLQIIHISGDVANSRQLIGNTSNAIWTVSDFNKSDFGAVVEELADNLTFQTEGDEVIDFTSTNPFGDP